MADKQELLKAAVPELVSRLVNPPCVTEAGRERSVDFGDECPSGSARAHDPVRDLHVGVITSSLALAASLGESEPPLNDRALLLPAVREGLVGYDEHPFLTFGPGEPNAHDLEQLKENLADTIAHVGEDGFGFESPLEAWYRFLVDPTPARSFFVDSDGRIGPARDSEGQPILDDELLEQRRTFLRRGSLVSVVLLSDEDDCSLKAPGILSNFHIRMPRATSACATNPNDECCMACTEQAPPAGCPAPADDPACSTPLPREEDPANLRCFDQKRRFGVDFLQPLSRYVEALTGSEVSDVDGNRVKNPLFFNASGEAIRDVSLVTLTGIVGVPWQDLATDGSNPGMSNSLEDPKELEFMTARELDETGRWQLMLGDPSASPPVPPSDPFMIASEEPREGEHPLIDAEVSSQDSTDPNANPINGHEHTVVGDLQYACIFRLATPRDCSEAVDEWCDCVPGTEVHNKPLCNPPGGGPAGTTQYFAKAYPGLRELALLKTLGDGAVVGSICPKVVPGDEANGESSLSVGYLPAISSLLARVAPHLTRAQTP
jgi:hypothetical protein